MTQLKISPLLTAALIMCATSARAEVQKFLNPCSGQKLCASYTLVLTPPDGWVVDDKATNENKVQIMVPKGQSFAGADPLIYVQVFYQPDKQQALADFARLSNARWLAANPRAKVTELPAVEPVEREDDLIVMRDLAADQSGIAALRYDRGSGVVGKLEDGGDFGDRSRPQHHRRMAAEQIAHFNEVGRLSGRIGDGVFVANDGGEALQQSGIDRFTRLVVQFIEHQAFPAKSSH